MCLSAEERWFPELELVRHLSECGEREEALQKVDLVLSGMMGASGHQGAFADALTLRWEITKKEEDFWAAKNELENFTDSQNWQALAIILIDHGDFDEADRVLAGALNSGDTVAKLLIIDARLRANRIEDAREVLQGIASERSQFVFNVPTLLPTLMLRWHARTMN